MIFASVHLLSIEIITLKGTESTTSDFEISGGITKPGSVQHIAISYDPRKLVFTRGDRARVQRSLKNVHRFVKQKCQWVKEGRVWKIQIKGWRERKKWYMIMKMRVFVEQRIWK